MKFGRRRKGHIGRVGYHRFLNSMIVKINELFAAPVCSGAVHCKYQICYISKYPQSHLDALTRTTEQELNEFRLR